MEQMNDDFNRQAGNHACEPEEALSCRISADGPIVFPGSEQSVDRSALSIFAFTIFDTGPPLHLCTWAGPPPYRGPTPKPLKICEWPHATTPHSFVWADAPGKIGRSWCYGSLPRTL